MTPAEYLNQAINDKHAIDAALAAYPTHDCNRFLAGNECAVCGATKLATEAIPAKLPAPGTYTVVLTDDSDYVTLRLSIWRNARAEGSMVAAYLSGSDNGSDYTGFAGVNPDGTFMVWRRATQEAGSALDRQQRALRFLLAADDEARREAGASYAMRSGCCCRCGRELTVPASLHRGLGPECQKKGWN